VPVAAVERRLIVVFPGGADGDAPIATFELAPDAERR
jgi:hypothetical protein